MSRSIFSHLIGKPKTPKAAEDPAEDDEKDMPPDDTEDEDGGKGEAAEDDDKEDDGGGDEPKGKTAPSPMKAALALIKSPLAKGREKLAASLAERVAEGKMTGKDAEALLAEAPKASRLGDTMAGRDINPGAGAPPSKQQDAEAAWGKSFTRAGARKRQA